MSFLEKQDLIRQANKMLSDSEGPFSLLLLVKGVVQGVGFRPFVYRIAKERSLTGEVSNNAHGVEIRISGGKSDILSFLGKLQASAPPLSVLREIHLEKIAPVPYTSFKIKESERGNTFEIDITADIATCPLCLEEMADVQNPRYRYPFINCTDCGPRYSIIKDLPYDRPETTMSDFAMCPRCEQEYHDPDDRRFHAQPIACPECGPRLALLDSCGEPIENGPGENTIEKTCALLKEGQIVAIKGLGGFHLACRADRTEVIETLRRRKRRDGKPFAVMVKDLSVAEKIVFLSEEEKALLSGFAKPILLARKKENLPLSSSLAPGLNTLGIMLAYTPLHTLLFQEGGFDALVMTSANVSDEPMVHKNEECVRTLRGIADFFLVHDREIQNRIDDSLVRVVARRPIFLRRARGYTPESLPALLDVQGILACGGVLKSTVAIGRGQRCYVSPYIGKMENLETYRSLEETVRRLLHLTKVKPEIFACDLHPGSLSARFARHCAKENGAPVAHIQHHHAHAVSCMAENEFGPRQKGICVVYDGTGYGEDGTIWGGEILLSDYETYRRVAHLSPAPLPGGELAIKQPWRAGMGFLFAWLKEKVKELFPRVAEGEKNGVLELLESNVSCPVTSSMGRLFDALSALSGTTLEMEYEGQPAMELEALAQEGERGEYVFSLSRAQEGPWILDGGGLLLEAVMDIEKGGPVSIVSARFHNTIARATSEMAYKIAQEQGIHHVFLSGGCFQNALLLRKTMEFLEEKGLKAYTHRLLSPNDEGISYGQALVAATKK